MENKELINFFKPLVDSPEELEIIKLMIQDLDEEKALEILLNQRDEDD